MTKKYTFEQVIRLLKKHANDEVPYVFEYLETATRYRQRVSTRLLTKDTYLRFEIYDNDTDKWEEEATPFCFDGWELVRPVKAKRERVKVGGIDPDGVITVNGYTAAMLGIGYDIYAVKR
jgi:hypothetical protein